MDQIRIELTKISYPSVFLFLALFAETKMLASDFSVVVVDSVGFVGLSEEMLVDGDGEAELRAVLLFLRIDLFFMSLSR